jgi:hypothetical protein
LAVSPKIERMPLEEKVAVIAMLKILFGRLAPQLYG